MGPLSRTTTLRVLDSGFEWGPFSYMDLNKNKKHTKTLGGSGDSEPNPKTSSLAGRKAESPLQTGSIRGAAPRVDATRGGRASEPTLTGLSGRGSGRKSESTPCTVLGSVSENSLHVGSKLHAESRVGRGVVGPEGMASTSKGLSPSFPAASRTALQGSSSKPKRQPGQSRRAFSDQRIATKIVERYGDQNTSQVPEKYLRTLEWARMVLSGAEKGNVQRGGASAPPLESGVKRQRSQEEEASLVKKPKTGGGLPKSFSEIAKRAGSIILGVVDNGREDGAISREEWKKVASAVSAVFMKVVRENPGPPPCCESAGWHFGTFKRIVCADERSAAMYRAAVALVGEVWKGAKLEAVDKKDLPLRPRARVWLPSEPSAPEEMEEILRYCNPNLPTHNWKVVKVERSEGSFRQVLILLNAESLGPLTEIKGVITYGFERVVLKVYQTDVRGGVTAVPEVLRGDRSTEEEAPVDMEVESVMSDGGSTGGAPSLAESVFSIGQLFDKAEEEERLLASDSEGADLGMLEKIIEDEYSSDKSSAL